MANYRYLTVVLFALQCASSLHAETELPRYLRQLISEKCLGCHDGDDAESGLDLADLALNLSDRNNFIRWVLIHDRIRDGEMPPPDDGPPRRIAPVGWSSQPLPKEAKPAEELLALHELATALNIADRNRIAENGRSKVRRLNRFEYENKLRHVLDAPWLQVADQLPEDAVDHLYNKIADRLDVSHVQMTRYLDVAGESLRVAVNAAAHRSQTRKLYAREEDSMHGFLGYSFPQHSATRAIVPLLGDPQKDLVSEVEVIRGSQPKTVGSGDPERRELEAMGVFCGTFGATTKYDFRRIQVPIDGEYKIRFKTFTFMAGPNGASGGKDHGLTGGNRKWWRPDRNVVMAGTRSEPITLYALDPSGGSRWLATFDSTPEPKIFEATVMLKRGEGIRPDAGRLVRTRPGWDGNPNATKAGVPGFAMYWMEVEGPLYLSWPPPSYTAVLGDVPFDVGDDGVFRILPNDPDADAARLIHTFFKRVVGNGEAEPYVAIYRRARELEEDFADATLAAMSAILCSPDAMYLTTTAGELDASALNERLAYFLWNSPPEDSAVLAASPELVDQMLNDERSHRFVDAFLDYWLDLRDINANAPDAELYPDYYLDDLLTESSVLETRKFFLELIEKNLPVQNLVDSDFAFVNERLANHYGLNAEEGVALRRVKLPRESPRGGLLTQASVLRVTANGTTTSPVTRGAWVLERMVGIDIPDPPSGVAAVDPDIRGAETIREQLAKHRENESCNACHARFDPIGFALESFDVAGGWRERYRSIGDEGEPVEGLGKNGHAFEFRRGQPIDCSGRLRSGDEFEDIRQLKSLLVADQRQLARNFLHQLIAYSTGSPVTFGDRAEVEVMLDRAKTSDYGVRTLIHELVRSKIFRWK